MIVQSVTVIFIYDNQICYDVDDDHAEDYNCVDDNNDDDDGNYVNMRMTMMQI